MSEKLRVFLARRDKAVAAAKLINAAAKGLEVTGDEHDKFDKLMAEVAALDVEINAEKREIEKERNAPPIAQNRSGGPDHPQYLDHHLASSGRRYLEMFPNASADAGGFKSLGEFFAVVRSGLPDARLLMAAASGGSEGTGIEGGFVVPTQFVSELLDESLEDEIVRPRAAVRPMTSSALWVAGFDTLNHSTSIGGFDSQWVSEGNQFNFQKAKLRNLLFKANKLGILTAGSNELLADSSFYSNELPELMIKAISFGLDEAFLRGDGIGKPLGALSDLALISVAKEAGQPADTITWNNIKAIFERLHPQSQKKAVWVITHTAKVQLLSLIQLVKNVAGTENVGGTWIPVMREEDGRFFILGLEVFFTEKVPILGDKGDILLADFSQYIIGLRKEVAIDRSGHLLFATDETAFRAVLRGDGMGRWNAPVLPRNGTAGNSTSWCVTLDARA